MTEAKKVSLILEDGTRFDGKSFGYEQSAAGEIVFYTAMTGYPESLTDPSYTGQILVSTFPLIGNYGTPTDGVKNKIQAYFESDKIHTTGLVISDYSVEYSHWNAQKSLGDWLKEQKVPGIYGVDTRALTKILRTKGSMLGKIEFDDQPIEHYNPNAENLVAKASCTEVKEFGEGEHRVVLIDCGTKNNIIRCLINRNCTVVRVPWDYDFTQEDYDGVFISNGPGDPAMADATVLNIKKAIDIGKPIMGICMGNQLLARAAGAQTYKMTFGHRSHNQPVLLAGTDRCYITSQNHGFAIDTKSLPADWEELFVNVNDGSNEGIRHKSKPFFSTQFHPEASSGPVDTEYLFDEFIENIVKHKNA